jgi:RNA polymerase sigma-70 factor (ECF subfamily)
MPTILKLPPPFEEAMRRHEREIMRVLLRVTGDREDALDLFQETWLRAYRAYPRLDSNDGLRPWLYRIAINLCRNRARDRSRRARVISAETAGLSDGASAGASGHTTRIHLRRLIGRLPDKQREALIMRQLGGFDYREIGTATGCSAQSARANFSLAMRRLRAQWQR